MSYKLITLQNPNKKQLQSLIDQFELSDNKDSSCYEINKSEESEQQLLENIIKRTLDSKIKLHILLDEKDKSNAISCGLLALNFETIGDFSALSVDLIFISKKYRSKYFKELDTKVSFYLLEFALQQAVEMNNVYQLDAVILSPINNCVSKVYQDFGFKEFGDGWLYFLVNDIE